MKRTSLKSKVFLTVVICLLVIQICFGIYTYYSEKSKIEKELVENMEIIGNDFGLNVIQPFWDFNKEQTIRVIDAKLQNDYVVGILVLKQNNDVFVGRQKLSNQINDATAIIDPDLIVKDVKLIKGTEFIGTAKIYFSEAPLQQYLQRILIQSIIVTFVLLIITAFVLSFFLDQVLLKPIKKLTAAASKIADGDLNTPLPELDSNDEISDVKEVIALFSGALKYWKEKAAAQEKAATQESPSKIKTSEVK